MKTLPQGLCWLLHKHIITLAVILLIEIIPGHTGLRVSKLPTDNKSFIGAKAVIADGAPGIIDAHFYSAPSEVGSSY